ncbi:MAG: hypothetical protein IKU11_08375 [Clostridia bacterium]|nr:hypothetical protein [Clostridia bacterium]
MKDTYEDIIHLPHHVSKTRPPMSMADRAAQFSPFAALTGYDDAIRETGRLTDEKLESGEERLAVLNTQFRILMDHLADHPEISVTYFVPDGRKSGGAYVTARGRVKKVNDFDRLLILQDGLRIPMDDVVEMEFV